MTLGVPKYPEFADLPRQEQDMFYIPELEMVWKEVCSAMKKCWTGYKIARREADTERQEYYADIISGILEGLGYRLMKFRINDGTSSDGDFVIFDEGADSQEYISEGHEVVEIEQEIDKRRAMALEYGKKFKKVDWGSITKQFVTYITPEESEEGYIMAMDEDQEVQYETVY
jgi:hypothetical protein